MSNDSRSNISLSITRRNKESSVNIGGGASETLNKLVQSSVQNLSKILQRPASNQERHSGMSEDKGSCEASSSFREQV